jgi:hypothetical protein
MEPVYDRRNGAAILLQDYCILKIDFLIILYDYLKLLNSSGIIITAVKPFLINEPEHAYIKGRIQKSGLNFDGKIKHAYTPDALCLTS